jgi:hypothetical protein
VGSGVRAPAPLPFFKEEIPVSDYADFLPKVVMMKVGSVELEAQELTIAKRDAALKIILSGLDIATLVKPFWDAAKNAKSSEEVMVDLTVLVKQLKDVLIRVLGNDLTTVSCLCLDTPTNRKKIAVLLSKVEVEKLSVDSKHGYFYSPLFFEWLKESLTTRQEYRLVEVLFEINDFVGLLKNYVALATGIFKAAREKVVEKAPAKGPAAPGA